MELNQTNAEMNRRNFLAGVLAGAVVFSARPALSMESTTKDALSAHSGLGTAFEWIRPGVGILEGWFVESVGEVSGAIRITATNIDTNENFVLDICRLEGAPRGIESTTDLDFFLMNQGAGVEGTGASSHQAIRLLREVIAKTPLTARETNSLLTHAQRLEMIDVGTLQFAS